MTSLEQFLSRAEALLARVEAVLPPPVPRQCVAWQFAKDYAGKLADGQVHG